MQCSLYPPDNLLRPCSKYTVMIETRKYHNFKIAGKNSFPPFAVSGVILSTAPLLFSIAERDYRRAGIGSGPVLVECPVVSCTDPVLLPLPGCRPQDMKPVPYLPVLEPEKSPMPSFR